MGRLKKIFSLTVFVLFVFFSLESAPSVCLNMIVKNEAGVIKRCLDSVEPLIDTWVIVDTGSTDGTQNVIKQIMEEKNIQGTLYEREWKNFEHNRNEALQLSKGKADYVLLIDADDYLVYEKDFTMPPLIKDFYYIDIVHGKTTFKKISLINTKQDWSWVGVLHEVLTPQKNMTFDTLLNVKNICTNEGARSKNPQKFSDDAKILEEALVHEPNNSRYVFYLAQSYRDNREYEKAIETYTKRVTMGGWKEEVFYSALQIAIINEKLEKPESEIVQSYLKAFSIRPSRMEPIYHLTSYYNKQNEFDKAYKISKLMETTIPSTDILFTQPWIREYGILSERALAAYWIGNYRECKSLSENLLKIEHLPENYRNFARECIEYSNSQLLGKS